MNERFEFEYKQEMSGIGYTPAQKQAIALRAASAAAETSAAAGRAGRARPLRKAALAAVSCVLALTVSVTALAAGLPSFRQWLFGPESGLAESLQPIEEAAEADGIRLELLGAMTEDTRFTTYFTLQDTRKAGRLAGAMENTVWMYPVAHLDDGSETPFFTNSSRVHFLEYDQENQTLLCKFDYEGPYPVANCRVKLTVPALFLGVTKLEDIPLTLPRELLSSETAPVTGVQDGDALLTLQEYEKDQHRDVLINGENWTTKDFLQPWAEPLPIEGSNGAQLSAAGFVDGKLRIQLYCPGQEGLNSRPGIGAACAKRESGQKAPEAWQAIRGFTLAEDGGLVADFGSAAYQEELFDISPEELDDYEFTLSGFTAEETVARGLEVCFDLTGEQPQGIRDCGTVTVDGIDDLSVTLTPMGAYLTAGGENWKGLFDLNSLRLVCGEETAEFQSLDSGTVTLLPSTEYTPQPYLVEEEMPVDFIEKRFMFQGAPVDPAAVTAIEIDGKTIPLE